MTALTSKGIQSFWLKTNGAQEVKRMNSLPDQLNGYRLEETEKRSNRFLGADPGRGRLRAMYIWLVSEKSRDLR